MRKLLLVAGLAAAAVIPSITWAQTSCEQQRDNRVVGTVAGAGIGALIGSAVAGRDNRAAGAVGGAFGGAIIGNQLTKPDADCAHAYGYYDRNDQWHATTVDRADARGYYDREGAWVDGAPNGYYDQGGRWMSANDDASADGYYDSYNRWIPASAGGYYNNDGAWVATASGYYDTDGRWIAGQTAGAYDADGRWTPGARSGHEGADGVWVADAQPGYYDGDHRWRAGPARGYYDARGAWIAMAPAAPSADARGADISYESRRYPYQTGSPRDLDGRERWLEQRIGAARDDGSLSRYQARRDMGELNAVRDQEANRRDSDGSLSRRDEAQLQQRLDRLSANLGQATLDPRRGY